MPKQIKVQHDEEVRRVGVKVWGLDYGYTRSQTPASMCFLLTVLVLVLIVFSQVI